MPSPHRVLALLFLAAGSSLLAGGARGEGTESPAPKAVARLTFVKTFKGSQPEYARVTVEEDGQATYQGGSEREPSEPESFRLSPAATARVFALAGSLNYFRGGELEYPKPVAYMGQKTFAYEKGSERAQVSYNYTQNPTGVELQQWFERIARGRFLIQQLDFQLQFDRLGVLQTLREFERDFNAGELVDLEQFVPVLERLAGDRRVMRLAQARAQRLLGRIRGAPARIQFEHGDQRAGWYTKVIVDEPGATTYEKRRFDQPPQELPLALPPAAATRLAELVRQANHFRNQPAAAESGGPLSGYRLTYEAGMEHHEVAFSAPPDATLAEIVHLFRQALAQEDFRQRLRAALEKDPMMLQVVLQELEEAVRADALADPKEFVPMLRQIADGSEIHPLVREQAGRLLARIRAGT